MTVNYGPAARNGGEVVTAEDIRELEAAGDLERTNTGHDAWKRRTGRDQE